MKYIIGFSGGLDSTCLLHRLVNDVHIDNSRLVAVHINHNVSPSAKQWQAHCQQFCADHSIQFKAISLTILDAEKKGFEAAARDARYAAFAELMEADDILLTGHHQDDQAETFLLQALRGAGVNGLAGMPYSKVFANGEHQRPLLTLSRAELLDYAQRNDLSWVEDESNQEIDYARNFLRHEVIPRLQQRWPSVQQSFAQSSQYAAEAMALAEALAIQDIHACLTERLSLSITRLQTFEPVRQKNMLRYWLQQKCSLPSGRVLDRIFTEVIPAAADAMPLVSWKGGNVRRYQDELYCDTKEEVAGDPLIEWDWQQPIDIINQRYCVQAASMGIPKDSLPKNIMIQFRQAGDKVSLFGNKQRKSLKKLLQLWQVPPWQRESLPLFFAEHRLIAAPPYYHATIKAESARQSLVQIKTTCGAR